MLLRSCLLLALTGLSAPARANVVTTSDSGFVTHAEALERDDV